MKRESQFDTLYFRFLIFFFLSVIWAFPKSSLGADKSKNPIFRVPLSLEPEVFDPAALTLASGKYLMKNLYRPLMGYDENSRLIPLAAEKCEAISPLKVRCVLRKTEFWSDGKPVKAIDFEKSFKRIFSSGFSSSEYLISVKNAKDILSKKKTADALGVTAKSDTDLEIDLAEPDAELITRLTSLALSPVREPLPKDKKDVGQLVTNGPYRIESWVPEKSIKLIPNKYLKTKSERLNVEMLILDSDVALRLYDSGQMDFVRNLPLYLYPKYRDRKDLLRWAVARFDYIAFGPAIKDHPHLRKALALSLNYKDLQVLLNSEGPPGCPSISSKLYDGPICYSQNIPLAKEELRKESSVERLSLQLKFSSAGGENHKRVMEWVQNQWKTNLGLEVSIDSIEAGQFLHQVRTNPPPVYRKGVSLEFPLCLHAMRDFLKDSKDYKLGLPLSSFWKITDELKSRPDSPSLCHQAIQELMDNYIMIPLGEMHFTGLVNPHFQGWTINSLDQLDLTNLRYVP